MYDLTAMSSIKDSLARAFRLGITTVERLTMFRILIFVSAITLTGMSITQNAHAKGGDILQQAADNQVHRQQAVASAVDGLGNLVVTGFRNLTTDTNDDFWTVKFAPDGTVLWRAAYNRSGGSDQATAVIIDAGNNVIVTGYSWNGSNNDVYTVKYNGADGSVIWDHTYAGLPIGNEMGSSLAYDSTNNVIYVGGYVQNAAGNDDYLLLKYDNSVTGPNNSPMVTAALGGAAGGNDRISSLAFSNGTIAATGSSWNGTDFDVLTALFEVSDTIRWQKRYSSTGSYPESGRYVQFDGAGNILIAATVANQLDYDIYVAKYSATDGSVLWDRTYNGAFDDEPMGLSVGSDGDIYVTGYTWTLAGSNDFYTARHNGATGATVWQNSFNSAFDYVDIATTTGITVDNAINGDVYVTGYTVIDGNYDYKTLKYKKENGHLLWQRSYNGSTGLSDRTVGIGLAPNNGVYVVGWTDSTAPVAGETSTATGGGLSSVVNSSKTWTTDQWANYYVKITSGPNRDVVRKISSNTASALTVSTEFGTAVAAGDSYYIFDKDDYDLHVISYDRGDLNPPTGLVSETASKEGNGTYTIHLAWEDNSPDETGFIIERKLGEFGTWSEIARIAADSTDFDDPGLTANQYYYYQVKTYRNAEESYPSNDSHSLTFLVNYLTPVWQKTYNGGENMEDRATAIAVGPDDNPVITGRSDSGLIGMFDFYTFKLNRATGSILWDDRYDSMQNETDMAVCLAVDNNNDIVVSGFSSLYYAPVEGNVHSLFTMKYPSAGPPATWEKQYNGPAGIDDRAMAIASATDGSTVYVAGYGLNSGNNNDIYLVKYLADGTQSWAITPIDGGRNDYPSGVAYDPQGNVIITGYRQGVRGQVTDLDNFDIYTAKFNGATGVKMWEDVYNPYSSGDARGQSIAVDPTGDVYVTGYVTNDAENRDYYTIKYNGANGIKVWTRSYDGPAHGDDSAIGIKVDPVTGYTPMDGNVIVVGTRLTDSIGNDSDIHLIRYSADGEIRWERTLLRPDVTDTAEAFAIDSSGYIYVAGDTGNDPDRDLLAVIYDYEGTLLGGTTYDGGNGFDQASSITANHQGEAFIAGYTTNASQNTDYLVIKQKNEYMLVPTPFTATPQTNYNTIALSWRENSPGTSFRIERTVGPVQSGSTWEFLADLPSGTLTYNDTGRSPNTQYCYRIEAYQGSLPSRKVVSCGTTTLQPPALNTLTSVTTAQITLTWNNIVGNSGYKVERKIGTGSWETHPNGILAADTATFIDTGLTAGTQYTYRVSIKNISGYSLTSNESTGWTLPVATTISAPVVVTTTRVDLAWSDVTGETGYRVERKTGTAGSWQSLGNKGVGVLTHSDTTPVANTEYFYRVMAFNSSGDATPSAEQRAVTPAAPVTLTSAVNAAPGTTINLTWNDLADETVYTLQESRCSYPDNPTYCTTYFSNDSYWSAWTAIATPAANATSYSRTGLLNTYAYRYRIIATVPLSNGAGNNSTSPSNLKGSWTWMVAPTVTVVPASETSLAISWNNIFGETAYNVDRKQGQAGAWGQITAKTTNTVTHTDTGLAQQTEYCYRVTATSTAGTADLALPPNATSNEFCLPTPLPAPTINTPTVASTTQINLSWNNIAGNNGYEVERCIFYNNQTPQYAAPNANTVGYWNSCTTLPLPADTTVYQYTGLTAGYTYRFRIRDSYGVAPVYYSAWSSPAVATTTPPTPVLNSVTANSTSQLTVAWGSTYGETEYRLEWKPRVGADCSAGTWNGPISVGQNVISYAHTGLTAGTYYCYRLKAYNNPWGESAYSNERSQTTTVNAPVLSALTGVTISSAQLNWTNVSGNTGYRISRKTAPTGTYSVIASVGQDVTTYPASGLAAGTFYGFKIEAQNAAGYSAFSNEQTTTTTPGKPTLNPMTLSSTSTELSWQQMKGATDYKFERRLPGDSWNELTNLAIPYVESYCGYPAQRVNCSALTASSSSYVDQGLTEGGTYCYQLKAYNATGGDSVPSTEVCIGSPELAAPALTATPVHSLKVDLAWNYTPGSCASGPCETPTGYLLEKQTAGSWQPILQADYPINSFTDSAGINPNNRYSYRVRAYAGILDLFTNGISASRWSQQGINRNNAGTVVANSTTPPINIVDATNGSVKVTASGGGVLLTTSSPGGGLANSYNHARISMLNPSAVHGNFDVQIDYRIPEVPANTSQYHVYGRLHIDFPTSVGANYAFIERSTGVYQAYITVNDVQTFASLSTSDTAGKLRLTRHGDRITAYAWTAGRWQLITEKSGASLSSATGINFTQYAQRNESVSLKIVVDNFEATSNKSAYSQAATATTPAYTPADGNCP